MYKSMVRGIGIKGYVHRKQFESMLHKASKIQMKDSSPRNFKKKV